MVPVAVTNSREAGWCGPHAVTFRTHSEEVSLGRGHLSKDLHMREGGENGEHLSQTGKPRLHALKDSFSALCRAQSHQSDHCLPVG